MHKKRLDHLGTDRLRKGRRSIPGARYFLTICTEKRIRALREKTSIEVVRDSLRGFHTAADLKLHCATVMPDHCHLLFTLGDRLTLSQIAGKLKRQIRQGIDRRQLWQDNFHEHRLRPEQELEPFARYIFLNPYRKGLIECHQVWPGWIRNKQYLPEFYPHLSDGQFPPREWLADSPSCPELIQQVSQ